MTMNKIREFLSGRKTYIVGAGAIIAAVLAWTNGTLDNAQAIEAIVAALVAIFLRAGIAKSGPTG